VKTTLIQHGNQPPNAIAAGDPVIVLEFENYWAGRKVLSKDSVKTKRYRKDNELWKYELITYGHLYPTIS